MIEKLNNERDFKSTYEAEFFDKINELIEWANNTETLLSDAIHSCLNHEGKLNAVSDMVNVHEKEIDKLQMLVEPDKCKWDDEREWIGHLCKFRDGEDFGWQYGILTDIVAGDYPYWMGGSEWAECQPVLEEEFKDVIYKKGEK